MFPLDFSLPERIFQRRLVNEALGRFRTRHGLGPLQHRVKLGRRTTVALGQEARQRYLQVRINRPSGVDDDANEDALGPGFGFKLATNLRWGANAVGTIGVRNLNNPNSESSKRAPSS